MKAIWSMWTVPWMYGVNRWSRPRAELTSWILSVCAARRHFIRLELYTDSRGARLLADQLRLPFDSVNTTLDCLCDEDPRWWALGKLYTYRLQAEPFVHIDADVFLWDRLPMQVLQAPLCGQNPEPLQEVDTIWYQVRRFEASLPMNAWLPDAWRMYATLPREKQLAVCCGIFGGNHVGFIRWYAETAFAILQHSNNRAALARIDDKEHHMTLLEQYWLSAAVHMKMKSDHSFRIEYLFDSPTAAAVLASRQGYTHLIGQAKMNQELQHRLEVRAAEFSPESYERMDRYFNDLARHESNGAQSARFRIRLGS